MSISHALVLPDRDFTAWLEAARPYMNHFERVAVVRDVDGPHLSRFRNVTAIQTLNMWAGNNALSHVRRAFPSVVRIDVIPAATPAQLANELSQRIRDNDRYGEKRNTPKHIFDRFVIGWPTAARPAAIIRGFINTATQKHEGLDITATPDGEVRAGADGTVSRVVMGADSLNYNGYIQITSVVDNEAHVVTYAGLRNPRFAVGSQIRAGDIIGVAATNQIKVVVQKTNGGLSGFKLPNVVDPTDMIYWGSLRLRPNVAALRVRDDAGLHGNIAGIVTPADLIEPHEGHGRTLLKVGKAGQWIRIRYAGVPRAYCGASFLDALGADDPAEAFPGINLPGMNLDLDHVGGTPDAAPLRQLGWVRLLYNVSLNPNFPQGDSRRFGNTDINLTFNRYRPTLERYANAGLKTILIFTHQMFGEGQGYVWHQMDAARWRDHANKYIDMIGRIAAQFRGRNLIGAYQIWNEQDTPPQNIRSAVPMPVSQYAYLLTESIKAIRQHDTTTPIITGGHIHSSAYASATLAAMPSNIRPDGIAFHPYGRGKTGSMFAPFGSLIESVEEWSRVLPGKPLWITEWGVLDLQGRDDLAHDITRYAREFINDLRLRFPGQIAAACWYAWADGMDNGYGLVRQNGSPRQPLYDAFLNTLS